MDGMRTSAVGLLDGSGLSSAATTRCKPAEQCGSDT
jgi:hypothetical protein